MRASVTSAALKQSADRAKQERITSPNICESSPFHRRDATLVELKQEGFQRSE